MKKKNKIILIIFFSALVTFFLSIILYLNIPRVNYFYNEKTNTYYVEKVFGNYKEFKIENEYKGKKVTGIKRYAFSYQNNLNVIYLNDNLEEIETNSFYCCKNLNNVYFNKNLKFIRNNAFLGCNNLKEIDLSNCLELKFIEGSAFFDCVNLSYVKLPNINTLSIGDYAFFNTNILKLYLNKETYLYDNALNSVKKESLIYY